MTVAKALDHHAAAQLAKTKLGVDDENTVIVSDASLQMPRSWECEATRPNSSRLCERQRREATQ